MNETVQMLVGIGFLLTIMGTVFNAWLSYQNRLDIKAVHMATNSMKDALVATTEKESYARGVKAGEESSINIDQRGGLEET